MYVTASYGYRGLKITTMRAYTNEAEVANFLRRCRRTAVGQAQRSVQQYIEREQVLSTPLTPNQEAQFRDRFYDPQQRVRELASMRSFRAHAENTLNTLLHGTLEEFILTRHHPTIYYCEDNPVDPTDSGVRRNVKLGERQLIERLRNANVRVDDRINDIPLPEDARL